MTCDPPSRVAVIGDVGGHHDALRRELQRLGANPQTGRLPDDLHVIQLGDLVHRGPDSAGVLHLVEQYLTEQPEQWTQLLGNHEAQYIRPPTFEWPETLDPGDVDLLRDWWATGRLVAAAAFDHENASYLVTHAGLTSGFWRHEIGAPGEAGAAADALNLLARGDDPVLFRPGEMLGFPASDCAGPVWASAPTELLPSWLSECLPFNQIHGHSTFYDWSHRQWRSESPLRDRTEIVEARAHEITTFESGRIIGIDPGHGAAEQPNWEAWVARGASLRPITRE